MSTEWMAEGVDCVLFTPSRLTRSGGTINQRVIARLTARDVVLDDGTRLRRANPTIARGSWDPITRLLPADDPSVAAARKANSWTQLVGQIRKECDELVASLRMDAKADTGPLRAALDRLDAAQVTP